MFYAARVKQAQPISKLIAKGYCIFIKFMKHHGNLLLCVLSLLLGALIYIFSRTNTIVFFGWLPSLGVIDIITGIRSEANLASQIIPNWVKYNLVDGLWVFSLVHLINHIWSDKINRDSIFWLILAPAIAFVWEICQYFEVISGTFDIIDLVFISIGTFTAYCQIYTTLQSKKFIMSFKTGKHILSLVILCIFILFAYGSSDEPRVNADGTPMTERQIKVQDQFSGWDGSHDGLTDLIKNGMNDPDSYEHIETRFRDDGDNIYVITKFRGANAFGGKVVTTVDAKVDFNGNVIEIVSQE